MPSPPFAGSIAAAGVQSAAVNALSAQDSQLLLEISPGAVAYAGATLVFEALPVGSSVWFPVGGVQQDTLSVVTGTSAAPYAVSPDGTTLAIKFDLTGCNAFRVWAKALTSGTLVVQETSGSFFSSPPSGAALSYAVQLAILWQLAHLSLLISETSEKAAAVYVQNPIIPSGLAASVWDVNF